MALMKYPMFAARGRSKSLAPSFQLMDEDTVAQTYSAYVLHNNRTFPMASEIKRINHDW